MFLSEVALLVLSAADQAPEPEDVKAGWTAFALFLGLIVVIALLGISLTRHLRRVESNRKDGLFGDAPEDDEQPAAPTSAAP